MGYLHAQTFADSSDSAFSDLSGSFAGHTTAERRSEIAYAIAIGALRQAQDSYRTLWLSSKAIKAILAYENEETNFLPSWVRSEKDAVKADYLAALERFMDEDLNAEALVSAVASSLSTWRRETGKPAPLTPQWIVSGTYPAEPLYAKPILTGGEWVSSLIDVIR